MSDKPVLLADFRSAWEQHRSAYLEAVDRVGNSGWLILGKEVEAFEHDLAKAWGQAAAVGVANGLDALEIAFRALGAKPGDRFLTTPLSAFATTLAILRVGGLPEFVDVDDTGLIDLGLVRRHLTQKPGVKFFVPVHLFGHALPLDELRAIQKEFGVVCVEDCAQAIGARSNGEPVGAASPVCATSFYPTKNLGAFGDGGALLTSSPDIAAKARSLRDYGQTEKYVHTHFGMNSRLDELQAALLRSVQLPALDGQTTRRVQLAERYLRELSNPKVIVPPRPPASQSVWHLFPTIIEGDRESFRAHLKAAGIGTALHYPLLIPAQQAMAEVGIAVEPERAYPRAMKFAHQEVSLPIHPFMSDEDCSRVIAACNSWNR
ncbi:MAG: DegT/DnrJ/EryC1/StrS family aminotransferase [Archangium sp.]